MNIGFDGIHFKPIRQMHTRQMKPKNYYYKEGRIWPVKMYQHSYGFALEMVEGKITFILDELDSYVIEDVVGAPHQKRGCG